MRSLGAVAIVVTCVAFAACSGASSHADTSNDSSAAPSACERFQAAQTLEDACAALLVGGCPQTLTGYLATGPKAYARVGCGLTEIRDLDPNGSQSNTYAFDATGALVGFDRTYRDDSGFCATGDYTFGTLIGDCDRVRECNLPKDAAKTGQVCDCSCPDPPPGDGVFETTPACVYPVQPPHAGCDPNVLGELTDGVVLHYGCGVYVTESPNALTCSYDATGAFAGATREDSASAFCPGVTVLHTGAPEVACDSAKTCVWNVLGDVSDPALSELESCGDELPDPGVDTACTAWKSETDVAASCALIDDACPADERSYLAGLSDPTTIKAIVGCGITWYEPNSSVSPGGSAFAFDTDGKLVGYDIWHDSTFGPCLGMFAYEVGDDLKRCDVVESCDLGDDRMPTCR